MATIERDVVLYSKQNGNTTIDFPVTRFGNVEDGADTKVILTSGDYIPLFDGEDNGKAKKVAWNNLRASTTFFATCDTAAATAAKVATCDGFTLATGVRVLVKFSNNNTASSPTLNVNGTGAKPICTYSSDDLDAVANGDIWHYDAILEFIYDGTHWVIVGRNLTTTIDGVSTSFSSDLSHYATCVTAAGTAAKVVPLFGFTLLGGARVSVKFTYANTAANPTLNVGNTGAKSIMQYGTTAATSGCWLAKSVVDFVYDGTYWQIVNVSHAYKADVLTNSRTFQTNLSSTSTASFDGSANVTPGVTGTLGTSNGGTGNTTGRVTAGKLSGSTIGNYATAEGFNVKASGACSHAEGSNTTASGENAHTEGGNTDKNGTSLSNRSITIGGTAYTISGPQAAGTNSHAEGAQTLAIGNGAHAEGGIYYHNSVGTLATAQGTTHTLGSSSMTIYAPVAVGHNSHAEGTMTMAYYAANHAEGYGSLAAGYYAAHAEGFNTQATGIGSHAEGSSTKATNNGSHAEGLDTTASGEYSHAEGRSTKANTSTAHAEGHGTTADNYASHAGGKYNKTMTTGGSVNNTTGDVMVLGNGVSASSLSNCFRVTYAGAVYGKSAFNSTGADYAEYFEWKDGNPDGEDRVGYFVTMDGKHIRKAMPDEYILGIISGQPCIIGNADEDWLGRWQRDEFGRFVIEEVPEEEGGGWRHKANLDYDSTKPYVERKDRQEWSAVGMVGVLSVRDDGTCQVNGFCQVADGGTATAAEQYISGKTWRVIERVTDHVVKVVFR